MTKVMIAMPVYGTMPVKTVSSLIGLICHYIDNVSVSVQFQVDSLIYSARNDLSQKAIDGGYDYILWIDADMIFPADALERMLKHDVDIVTGLYFQRRGDHAPVVYQYNLITQKFETFNPGPQSDGLYRVDACGFGIVLTKVSAIKDIIAASGGLLFHPYGTMGEDLSFCYRYHSIGGEIWLDASIKCGHIGEYVFTQDDYIPL